MIDKNSEDEEIEKDDLYSFEDDFEDSNIKDGFKKEERAVWKELENQLLLTNDKFESAIKDYRAFMEKYEGLKNLAPYFKSENVINNFGNVLSLIHGEKKFLIGLLLNREKEIERIKKRYGEKIKESLAELKESEELEKFKKRVPKKRSKITPKMREAYERIMNGEIQKDVAKSIGITEPTMTAWKRAVENSLKEEEVKED